MSVSFMLYRAPADAGPPSRWHGDKCERLGPVEDIKRQLQSVLPDRAWEFVADSWRTSPAQDPVVSLRVAPEDASQVMFVRVRGAAESQLRSMCQLLRVRAFDFESSEHYEP